MLAGEGRTTNDEHGSRKEETGTRRGMDIEQHWMQQPTPVALESRRIRRGCPLRPPQRKGEWTRGVSEGVVLPRPRTRRELVRGCQGARLVGPKHATIHQCARGLQTGGAGDCSHTCRRSKRRQRQSARRKKGRVACPSLRWRRAESREGTGISSTEGGHRSQRERYPICLRFQVEGVEMRGGGAR